MNVQKPSNMKNYLAFKFYNGTERVSVDCENDCGDVQIKNGMKYGLSDY
jgi:hypothetical protein